MLAVLWSEWSQYNYCAGWCPPDGEALTEFARWVRAEEALPHEPSVARDLATIRAALAEVAVRAGQRPRDARAAVQALANQLGAEVTVRGLDMEGHELGRFEASPAGEAQL